MLFRLREEYSRPYRTHHSLPDAFKNLLNAVSGGHIFLLQSLKRLRDPSESLQTDAARRRQTGTVNLGFPPVVEEESGIQYNTRLPVDPIGNFLVA